MKKTALCIKNHFSGPDSVMPFLEENGIETRLVYAFDTAAMATIDPLAYDYAVFFGGPQGAYQVGDYPYEQKVMEIMRARHTADKPNLGFCLGAQMLAAALGGEGLKGENDLYSESGWTKVAVTEAGLQTSVRHFDAAETGSLVMEAHDDSFALPPDAVLLAASGKCRQAFALGNSLGLQFHPEITELGLLNKEACLAKGVGAGTIDLAQVRAENKQYAPKAIHQTRQFLREYLGVGRSGVEKKEAHEVLAL